ncbi:MAG: hypothetical protein ACOX0X_03260 [Candidatus Dojkabacteria bacterium]
MKKTGIYILIISLICLIGSFVLLFFEYTHYSDADNRLVILQKEVNKNSDRLNILSDEITRLKLEEETISSEKNIQIEQYKKWVRQNQILKDLIK